MRSTKLKLLITFSLWPIRRNILQHSDPRSNRYRKPCQIADIMAVMERRPRTYQDLAASVRQDFGVELEVVHVGGGNEVMHGRLETGHWLVVSDAEDFLSDIDQRLETDADGYPLGWFAGIYTNDDSDGVDRPASQAEGGCLAYVQRDGARLYELNDVIREVIGRLAIQSDP